MLCDICHKNEATIHLNEVVDKQLKKLNLCQECAGAKCLADLEDGKLDLAALVLNMASGALGTHQAGAAEDGEQTDAEAESVACPSCGLKLKDFSRHGRCGCAGCYGAFREKLAPLLEQVQRGQEHRGKRPNAPPAASQQEDTYRQFELSRLTEELERAVATEAYERAAELRDRIEGVVNGRQQTTA